VGVPYTKGTGVEALLDIEFIMGVAPGVKTEFWEWPNNDFCGDLHNYTATMLAAEAPPLSNSISYGWQGDLAQLHCVAADVDAVDVNWAKLAAKGISIMISSGDSGSGYSAPQCGPASGEPGKSVTSGTVLKTVSAMEPAECCLQSREGKATAGWMWTPPAKTVQDAPTEAAVVDAAADGSTVFRDAVFHAELSLDTNFADHEVHILNGALTAAGGTVKLHDANGTVADTTITFGPAVKSVGTIQRNVSATFSGKTDEKLNGRAIFVDMAGQPCEQIVWYQATAAPPHNLVAIFAKGPNPPPPPPPGKCTIYSAIASVGPAADPKTVTDSVMPKPSLYPSWPASSPWVTAVGATRFVGQVVGGEEMATDQFGSGGGFSTTFNQTHAQWQAAAVAKYVAMGPTLPKFPNASFFNPLGRATPDVSALGEGFQVYVDGKVQSVGGTSASSPSFAGIVSLLNEARFKAGKPQMGFLNPFLYANPDAFFDVVKGSNAFGRGPFSTPVGYACAPGWDAATGLGTPHFDKLLTAAMAAAGASDVEEVSVA